MQPSKPEDFILGNILIVDSILLIVKWLFKLSILYEWFVVGSVFQGICLFHLNDQIGVDRIVCSVTFYAFGVYR